MIFLLFACTTGTNYPRKKAEATCKTVYTCIDPDVIEDFLYDNIDECMDELESQYKNETSYEAFEEGDKDFFIDNADACLQEILEVQNDSDCDGNMDPISFWLDITTEECSEVYQ